MLGRDGSSGSAVPAGEPSRAVSSIGSLLAGPMCLAAAIEVLARVWDGS